MYPEDVRDSFVAAWSSQAVKDWGTDEVDVRIAATDHLARIETVFTLEEFAEAEFDMLCGHTTDTTTRWLDVTREWTHSLMPELDDHLASERLLHVQLETRPATLLARAHTLMD